MANTYYTPGSTTASSAGAPTAAQAAKINLLVVDVSLADASTTFEITHEWGAVLGQEFGASFSLSHVLPLILSVISLDATATIPSAFTWSYDTTNTVQGSKLSTAAGSGGTYRVILARPISSIL